MKKVSREDVDKARVRDILPIEQFGREFSRLVYPGCMLLVWGIEHDIEASHIIGDYAIRCRLPFASRHRLRRIDVLDHHTERHLHLW
jgi:hypothetical protein